MKKIQFLIAVAIAVLTLASCSDKNEPVVVNKSLIKEQLAKLSIPSVKEIQEKFTSSTSQKIKSEEFVSQRVFSLDKEYYEVTTNYAIRYLQYYEIGSGGTIKREIQLQQQFHIQDGVLDTTDWAGHFELEGKTKKCDLWFSDQIVGITVFFHRNDGLQLAYTASLYDGAIYLPPLADGKWQVQVQTLSKGVWQTFITMPQQINKSDPDELLLMYEDITTFTEPKENAVAIATVKPDALKGNFLLVCEDENGNMFSQPIPVTVNADISFAIPFKPKNIYIWGQNYQQLDVTNVDTKASDGLYHYYIY